MTLRLWTGVCAVGLVLAVTGPGAAQETERGERSGLPVIDLSGGPAFPLPAHLESSDIAAGAMSFQELFAAGDALFRTAYVAEDGVGAFRLPKGGKINRFSTPPPGGGAGAITSQSCVRCHVGTASGPAQANVLGDPGSDGHPPFRARNATSLWGNGILQLLAQEITGDLQAIRDGTARAAREPGVRVERALESKGVRYGVIAAMADSEGHVHFDLSGVQGVDPDLVVRPLGWKGTVPTVRMFTAGAAAGPMGLQAEELVWKLAEKGVPGPDPDGDGVERELSVGDVTAMVVYGAAQETPQSVERLAELGLVAQPSEVDRARIEQGRRVFGEIGCDSCHRPEMRLEDTVFEEPTLRGNGDYYDKTLAARDAGYDPKRPVRFDVLRQAQEPRAEAHPEGGALIRLYGDLKRHRMGRQLAEVGTGSTPSTPDFEDLVHDGRPVVVAPDEFLTPELWGVGNTGPWLHDGRAASLREAVMWHGEDEPPAVGTPGRGEAQDSRDRFAALPAADQEALLTFLRSLRTFAPTGTPPRMVSEAGSR
jgi:cytochrome c peroxidase